MAREAFHSLAPEGVRVRGEGPFTRNNSKIKMKNEKETINYSEDAEVLYFADKSIEVENYDTEVAFENTQKFQATVCVDEKGNVSIIPFGLAAVFRGPRSITLVDTGVAKIKQSPMGQNIKLEVILPAPMATRKNFLESAGEALKEWRKKFNS